MSLYPHSAGHFLRVLPGETSTLLLIYKQCNQVGKGMICAQNNGLQYFENMEH